jgi:hypothetical protein
MVILLQQTGLEQRRHDVVTATTPTMALFCTLSAAVLRASALASFSAAASSAINRLRDTSSRNCG